VEESTSWSLETEKKAPTIGRGGSGYRDQKEVMPMGGGGKEGGGGGSQIGPSNLLREKKLYTSPAGNENRVRETARS